MNPPAADPIAPAHGTSPGRSDAIGGGAASPAPWAGELPACNLLL